MENPSYLERNERNWKQLILSLSFSLLCFNHFKANELPINKVLEPKVQISDRDSYSLKATNKIFRVYINEFSKFSAEIKLPKNKQNFGGGWKEPIENSARVYL